MDNLDLPEFIKKNQLPDNSEGLTKLVDHINASAAQLSGGFGDDHHKTRFLRHAVMRLDQAQQPIPQFATNRYSLIQFMTILQRSLQFQTRICARTSARYQLWSVYEETQENSLAYSLFPI